MRKSWINILLLTIVSMLVFANTLKNPFMWDDDELIEMISEEKYQEHLKNPLFFFTPSYWKEYRSFHYVEIYVPVSPIRTLSLSLDYKIWKENPFGYHLTNIIFHAVNVLLVYLLVMVIFKDKVVALFAGLLFAVHPMHTEAVAWIKNRIELITSMVYLSSLILFVQGLKQAGRVRLGIWHAASGMCFILALLSKEMAVTLPLILVMYIVCFIPRIQWKRAVCLTSPFWLLTGVYVYFEFFIAKPGISQPHILDIYTNILMVFKTIAYYVGLLIFPFTFCADRIVALPQYLYEPATFISVISVGALIFLGAMIFKHSRPVSFFVLWFFVIILPVANIFYLAPRPIAEHRLYIPSIGFCVLLGKLVADWLFREGLAGICGRLAFVRKVNFMKLCGTIACLVLVFSYSLATVRRNFDWSDKITFWTKTLKQAPGSARAYVNLGSAYYLKGQNETAVKYYKEALKLQPGVPLTHQNLGGAYFKLGRIEEAVKEFQNAGIVP